MTRGSLPVRTAHSTARWRRATQRWKTSQRARWPSGRTWPSTLAPCDRCYRQRPCANVPGKLCRNASINRSPAQRTRAGCWPFALPSNCKAPYSGQKSANGLFRWGECCTFPRLTRTWSSRSFRTRRVGAWRPGVARIEALSMIALPRRRSTWTRRKLLWRAVIIGAALLIEGLIVASWFG